MLTYLSPNDPYTKFIQYIIPAINTFINSIETLFGNESPPYNKIGEKLSLSK
ncbi:hypothetical protein M128_4571 [Bacteroides fragilis str. S6L8]|uniref:Uncharacterized protein n=1 Tax=Bacteroides fragilis str. S36L11 TaxID=1339327 RepID=A0A015WX06_BACFG|nr:hypothetical protein M111_3903 [Bacteroides fragilis str. 3986T(B)10]EXZ26455.1 hypothetical protein M136_4422 [Bacteroides fragilis str. S36L11]EYA02651.1 hypothetical protein M126_4558 [Bacteroides fragilis str. S6L3]EYA93803.1 hypothetical protein M141_4232 [Bacteroides fragilis str. S38L5]EYA98166.1 hypothetical protein M128_4571 [Bacteroides fragilis str. S6L8]